MIDIQKITQEIWDNKEAKGFNTTDLNLEFCYTYGELSEAYEAYRKKLPGLGEELADVMIFLLSIAKMVDVDIEKEVLRKLEKNKSREYKEIDGVTTRVSGD